MHLGFIDLLFPNAHVIHCQRDPLDTCLSCYFQSFSGEHPYAYSLSDLGKYYRLYRKLMEHWKKVLRIPIYELSYESLVQNQEQETRKLLAVLWYRMERCLPGLPQHPAHRFHGQL